MSSRTTPYLPDTTAGAARPVARRRVLPRLACALVVLALSLPVIAVFTAQPAHAAPNSLRFSNGTAHQNAGPTA